MLDLYVQNKNSMKALGSALRIAIANANNFNTPGYKYTYASFTTMYTKAIMGGTENRNPVEVGSGMQLGSTSTDFSQGNLGLGTNMDLAIVGEGFFNISSNANELEPNSPLYTRSGRFMVDSSNTYIVDPFGRKLFGFPVDANGNITSTQMQALQTKDYASVAFQDGGLLVGDPESDNPVPLFKVAIATMQNKQGLVSTTGGAYKTTISSGEAFTAKTSGDTIGTDSSNVYGEIFTESVESANVDVSKVALDMSLLNRGFSANNAVVDDITKIISEFIKKIGG